MASYYFRNTGDTNWGTATNWSLTDGGGATGAVPTNADDAFFSNNSGNCVTNALARVCLSLDFTKGTGFTGTFTCSQSLTVSTAGNITLNGAMTWAGAASVVLTVAGTSTITSNGITITNSVTISGASAAITLADDMRISGNTLTMSAASAVYSGAFTIYFSGTSCAVSGACTSANTKLEFTGNVTISSFSQSCGLNEIRINTGSNTFTVTNQMNIGSSANTTTLTYVSGKISLATTNTLNCNGNVIFDTYSIKWNWVDFNNSDGTARTITLNSPLVSKFIKLTGSSSTSGIVTTFAGSYGFECDMLNIIYGTTRTVTLASGITYKINNFFINGTPVSSQVALTLNSSSSGVKARLSIGKYCITALQNIAITDVDNIGPKIIPVFQNPSALSSLTRSAGWVIVPNGQAYIPSTNIRSGLNNGIAQGLY